jgi:hypothetical protein
VRLLQAVVVALWPCLLGWCWALGLAGLAAVLPWLATHGACSVLAPTPTVDCRPCHESWLYSTTAAV